MYQRAVLVETMADGRSLSRKGPRHWLVAVAALVAGAVVLAGCGDGSPPGGSMTSSGSHAATLSYVAFGDSWPEGAHCNGCTTFAGLWAAGLQELTGRDVAFTDLTGSHERSAAQSKGSGSLLTSLQHDEGTRAAIRAADVVLVATGPNEMEQVLGSLRDGACGGPDQHECIRSLGQQWSANFESIMVEIDALRESRPMTIRLVNAANPFLSVPGMNEGLPEGFAAGGGDLIFELLTAAMCDAATAHRAVCIDVRPLLNGPALDRAVDENSEASMRAIADALIASKVPELDQVGGSG